MTSGLAGFQKIYYVLDIKLDENQNLRSLPDNQKFTYEGIVEIPKTYTVSKSNPFQREYRAKILNDKPRWNSTLISGACLIVPYLIINQLSQILLPGMPLYAIIGISALSYAPLAMAFHAARIGAISLYIILHALCDMVRGKGVVKTLKSHSVALVKQVKTSLVAIVKAPFYAIAFNAGHVVTLIAPRRGMKLVSQIEYAWNRNASIRESFSLLNIAGKFEKYVEIEGGGDIDKLKPNAFYLLRCYQPNAELRIIEELDPNSRRPIKRREEVWSEGETLRGTPTFFEEDVALPCMKSERISIQSNSLKV